MVLTVGSPPLPAYFSSTYLPPGLPPAPELLTTRILLDSRDAVSPDPTTFSGTYHFDDTSRGTLQNIVTCELKGISFPKVANETYVVLSMPQLNNDELVSSNSGTDRTFAVCYFDTEALPTGMSKPLKGTDFYQKLIRYRPALNKLDRLDVAFLKHNGSVITQDDVGGLANVHYSMILEVQTLNNRRW